MMTEGRFDAAGDYDSGDIDPGNLRGCRQHQAKRGQRDGEGQPVTPGCWERRSHSHRRCRRQPASFTVNPWPQALQARCATILPFCFEMPIRREYCPHFSHFGVSVAMVIVSPDVQLDRSL